MIEKKLHTCIIPCNTTLVWHVDKISTKYTHIIMDTFRIYSVSSFIYSNRPYECCHTIEAQTPPCLRLYYLLQHLNY